MSTINEKLRDILGINELKNYKTLFAQLFAEFLGSFLYLSIALRAGTENSIGPLSSAFANGLLFATVIQIFGHVSGGHLNPAVTAGVLIYGEIKVLRALSYVVVQVLGSIAGSVVAYSLTDPASRGNLGAMLPNKLIGPEQVFFLEFLQTFTLVSVFLSVIDMKRGFRGLGSAPLAIGLALTACQCSYLPYTTSLNPIKSLGPAVVKNVWTSHWVYWIATILGGMSAGLVYRFLLVKQKSLVIIVE